MKFPVVIYSKSMRFIPGIHKEIFCFLGKTTKGDGIFTIGHIELIEAFCEGDDFNLGGCPVARDLAKRDIQLAASAVNQKYVGIGPFGVSKAAAYYFLYHGNIIWFFGEPNAESAIHRFIRTPVGSPPSL